MKIPFNKPFMQHKQIRTIIKSLKSGDIGGNGFLGQAVERYMQRIFNIRTAFLTPSCTQALELAVIALGIKEGDEIILPSFSFVSAANAVARLKAKPIFVDIEDKYLNIDPQKIEEAITNKTKAIICVHYAGIGCNMREILRIAKKNNLDVIEDAAHAVGSKYNGRYLGTIGDVGCYSFHETKNFTCGEGGAFLTNNKRIAAKAEVLREKGTNRSAFLRGKVKEYTWMDVGSSYVLSDILAAILFEQLRSIKFIIHKREMIGQNYLTGLSGLEKAGEIVLPKFKEVRDFNWHIFYVRARTKRRRDYVIKRLRDKGIETTFHFPPLHLSSYAQREYGYQYGDFPVTEKASETLLRLPIYPDLGIKEQKYVIDSFYSILK